MSNELQTIDVTELVRFTKLISDIGGLNKMMAPNYLRDFINAMDLIASILPCSAALRIHFIANGRFSTTP